MVMGVLKTGTYGYSCEMRNAKCTMPGDGSRTTGGERIRMQDEKKERIKDRRQRKYQPKESVEKAQATQNFQ